VAQEIATLVGSRQLDSSIGCLRSLVARSVEPVEFRVHCDGTLSSADRDRLERELPVRRIVLRQEADALARVRLAHLPALKGLRESNVLALKLTDIVWFETSPRLTYVDSDVFFARTFSSPVHPECEPACVFFPDRQSAYSVRSRQLLFGTKWDLPARVNTGYFTVPVDRADFAVAEEFVRRWRGFAPPWIEQTCWALVAGIAATRIFDPAQMTIPVAGNRDYADAVAFHYVSSIRSQLTERLATAPASQAGAPVELRSKPARKLSALGLFLDEIRRLTARLARR